MTALPEFCEHDTIPGPSCNLQLVGAALSCDAYHHYYHYQASAQYLWLAAALAALDRADEAAKACERAVFQDHRNEEAIAGKKCPSPTVPRYDRHSCSDAEFCARIGQEPSPATKLHDAGIAALEKGDSEAALAQFNAAIQAEPAHSNSWFTRGRLRFTAGEFEKARADLGEAIRLSHLAHDAYHRSASDEHLKRGREFLTAGEIDLAIADFTKALDLYRGNADARKARAEAYRVKGSTSLAEEDERIVAA